MGPAQRQSPWASVFRPGLCAVFYQLWCGSCRERKDKDQVGLNLPLGRPRSGWVSKRLSLSVRCGVACPLGLALLITADARFPAPNHGLAAFSTCQLQFL